MALCIWGGAGAGPSHPLYLCGVEWVHGPYLGLLEWASLHCGGAVGERGGYPPQG